MEIIGYLSSILMGVSLGLIGGGGSILTVPILVYLFKIDPILATAYSLFIVGLTALFGGVQAYLKGQVDLKRGLIFAGPSFLGVYMVRAFIMPALPQEIFSLGGLIVTKPLLIMGAFAILMVVASYSMIKSQPVKNEQDENQNKSKMTDMQKYMLIGLEGLVVGGITGFVGAGGGFLIIPALVLLTGMPMKLAVGTSLMIISLKSLFGFIGDIQHQAVIDWFFLVQIAVIAVVGLFIGARLKSMVSEKALKKGFGYFVLVMGMFVLWDQVQKILG